MGTLTETTTGTVKVGGARDFDGSNDKVAATIPGMSTLSSWSFSLWFKWDNGVATANQHPIGFGQGHDVTLYLNRNSLSLVLKATDASGATVAEPVLSTFTTQTAKKEHHAAVTFDGTILRAYVDGVEKGPWAASALRIRTDALRIGTSASETSNFFDGKIDEVQVWDRVLPASEIKAYYNLTNDPTALVSWQDMDTRTSAGDLFDFGGNGHPGVATGTTIVEGRSGFARKFAGGTDGVVLSATTGTSFASGAAVSLNLLVSSYPATDTSLVSRKGSFYLNLTSDGRVMWTNYGAASLSSPLPIPRNRWIRMAATAGSAGLVLYLDGTQVASGSGAAPPAPSTASSVVLGYAEGQPHLAGSLDEVLVLNKVPASAWTLTDFAVRGILLNPNAMDTDFDGLADGQELFVKSVKTPKRYPTSDQMSVYTDAFDLGLGAPAWALSRADAMVGLTHEDMGQLSAYLYRTSGPIGSFDRLVTLRSYSNGGEANNFTSYDLLQRPSLSGDWLAREDLLAGGRTWYLGARDATVGKKGQIEYVQIQVTVRTYPNRADTDGDGLNDSEELNFLADGFQTDPWKADSDGDGLPDNEYAAKGTDPTRPDTDRDGYADNVDSYPLDDIFVKVTLSDVTLPSARRETASSSEEGATYDAYLEPFAGVTYGGETFYSPYLDAPTDGGYWTNAGSFLEYYVNVPDYGVDPLTFEVELWDYDFDVTNPDPIDLSINPGMQNEVSFFYTPGAVGASQAYTFPGSASGHAGLYATNLRVYLTAVAPARASTYVLAPLDYAGVVNVTDASGQVVSRRYAGEPRFVALTIEHKLYRSAGEVALYLVPRSIFHDTRFAGLLEAQALPDGLRNALSYSQNGTTSPNSDVLQAVLAGHLGNDDLFALEDLLARNATGNVSYRWIDVTAYLPLFNLPDDAIRLAGYRPSPHALTVNYTWDVPTQTRNGWTVWDRIWYGAVEAFGVVLDWIESAVVFVVSIVDAIVDAIVAFGSWLSDLTSGDPVRVARAVQAAQKAVEQFTDFLNQLVTQLLAAILGPLLDAIETWRIASAGALDSSWREFKDRGTNSEGSMLDLRNVLLAPLLPLALLATAVTVVLYLTLPISFGALSLARVIAAAAVSILVGAALQQWSSGFQPSDLSSLAAVRSSAQSILGANAPSVQLEVPTFWDWAFALIDFVLATATVIAIFAHGDPSGTADAVFAITFTVFGVLLLLVVPIAKSFDVYEEKWIAAFQMVVALISLGSALVAAAHSENPVVQTLGFIGSVVALFAVAYSVYNVWMAVT